MSEIKAQVRDSNNKPLFITITTKKTVLSLVNGVELLSIPNDTILQLSSWINESKNKIK